MAAERMESVLMPAAVFILIPAPPRYRPAPAASGTSVAPQGCKSFRVPAWTAAGLHV